MYYDSGKWELLKTKQGLICDTITNLYNFNNKVFVSTYLGVSILSGNKVIENVYSNSSKIKSPIFGLSMEESKGENNAKIYSFGNDWIGTLSDHNF